MVRFLTGVAMQSCIPFSSPHKFGHEMEDTGLCTEIVRLKASKQTTNSSLKVGNW